MAKARSVILGVGCLVMVVGVVLIALMVRGLASPKLPTEVVLAINLEGPIAEVTAEDPFAEIFGEQVLSLRQLRTALERAADDDRVRGVRLRIGSFGGGFAVVQELRDLLGEVRAAGKWTAAYLETAGEFAPGNMSYYLASACDEITLHPGGDVNLIGFSVRSLFVRGTLDKLGIKPEFPGRGAYKSARFMYTERDFTPEAREMTEWLVGSLYDQLVSGVAEGRGMTPAEVRDLVDRGPFLGDETTEAGLVDHREDWTTFTERLDETDGSAEVLGYRQYLERGPSGGRGARIAVVTGVGGIMRGESRREFNPLFGMSDIMGSDTIAGAFRAIRKAGNIDAVIFRVDSPGGSALASEIIREEMARTAETIPVVVSMADVAGSGGYWVTCGAQRIVAEPGTITGSIGVLTGHLNMDAFYRDKLGMTFGRADFGANADIYGSLEDWTDEQRAIVDRVLDRIYHRFVTLVAESRGMTWDEVDAIGRGRVFTGEQALANGLVDVLGGFDAALAEARTLADIGADVKVELVDFPKAKPWWQQLVHHRSDEQAAVEAALRDWEAFVTTGTVELPGEVWMPPVVVR
ncbi:MAG: signal peptide peptidase SppA [Thermoanaerobaculales bacterium]|jgi:protease-4|nr:signal peptide peptidase SppA [Thermoanaerobaculales bacterium]